ncbi:MAG: hypothetical protein WCI04_05305 [archaeon]
MTCAECTIESEIQMKVRRSFRESLESWFKKSSKAGAGRLTHQSIGDYLIGFWISEFPAFFYLLNFSLVKAYFKLNYFRIIILSCWLFIHKNAPKSIINTKINNIACTLVS